jgi:hypothetical protein
MKPTREQIVDWSNRLTAIEREMLDHLQDEWPGDLENEQLALSLSRGSVAEALKWQRALGEKAR